MVQYFKINIKRGGGKEQLEILTKLWVCITEIVGLNQIKGTI